MRPTNLLHHATNRILGFFLLVCFLQNVQAALITAVDSPADFNSSNIIVDNFDAPLGTASEYRFDSTATQLVSNQNQLARSGINYLADFTKPLTVTFTVETYEVGAYMGNDDDNPFRFGPIFFGQVDFFLDAFDKAGNLLGTVSVAGTGNDLIDQFVGLRSDVALGSAVFRNTSDFFNPGLALDDFSIGYELPGDSVSVAEPSTSGLIGVGLLSLCIAHHFRNARRRVTAIAAA